MECEKTGCKALFYFLNNKVLGGVSVNNFFSYFSAKITQRAISQQLFHVFKRTQIISGTKQEQCFEDQVRRRYLKNISSTWFESQKNIHLFIV
jgi:hypothetical protein